MAEGSDRGLKRFHGDVEDPGKALRQWKSWALAKMMTMKDLSPKQKAPWIYTLLDGSAWEAVEHLTLDSLAVEGGDAELWKVLHDRFPEKEPTDMMGEALGEVFALAATEGETAKQWTARVRETFDKCKRRANTDFPATARGWITLNCAGLSEEQKAIIKAKTQGSLEFDDVSKAFRSCFPMYKAGTRAKKPIGALAVDEDPISPGVSDEDRFDDVQSFLAEHSGVKAGENVELSESETAEALAVSWKERRTEIAKVNQARRFTKTSSSGMSSGPRRNFRSEVDELKKRTRCRRCGKLGHWARECRSAPSGADASGSSSAPHATGVSYVEVEDPDITFIGAAEVITVEDTLAAGLISSPGFGVVDTGCGKTLIGEETLEQVEAMLATHRRPPAQRISKANVFRFGNGAIEQSDVTAMIPVGIGGKPGLIEAAVIKGQAPLLLGRPTLQRLGMHLDFKEGLLTVLDGAVQVKMHCNPAGQVLLNILDFPKAEAQVPVTQPDDGVNPKLHNVGDNVKSSNPADNPKSGSPKNPNRRKVTLKNKECRCLLAQLRDNMKHEKSQIAVAELFSPPRFSLEAQKRGQQGIAFDLKQGWNLLNPHTQRKVDALLDELCPELLVVCPPCTYSGGWEHLNSCYRTPLERAKLMRENRARLKFSRQQIEKQVQRGGEFMFEHPWGASTWNDREFEALCDKFGVIKTDMCQHGLKCPETSQKIRKSTGLMASRSLAQHVRTCDGSHPHRRIEGKLRNGQLLSDYCAAYTQGFVRTMYDALLHKSDPLEAEVRFVEAELACLASEAADSSSPDVGQPEAIEPSVNLPEQQNSPLVKTLQRLHQNLGHPSTEQLVRILRHSKASSEAIECAKTLQCTTCLNHRAPAPALPANVPSPLAFNDQIGLDVKYVSGWKINQRVPCINIVDYGTGFQSVVPIYTKESSELIKRVLQDSWIAWAGPPKALCVDPAQPNISQAVSEFCEARGITLHATAGDAHWQLGKVERHGGWFSHILDKVLFDVAPASQEEFAECIVHAQTAKNSLINITGTSPYQLVFGRNPRIPSDLLQEDPDVGASEAIALQDGYARSNQIRQTARQAVLACQDSSALRAALRARPRPSRPFQSGDWVYYWRSQKWVQGKLIKGGQWCGAGMLLGTIGRNWIVAHRKNVIRCAPEQLRFASSEERVIADDAQSNELLGIKHLLERGQFPKSQFEDLVPLDNPPQPECAHDAVRMAVDKSAMTAGELIQSQKESMPTVPEDERKPDSTGSNAVPDVAEPASSPPGEPDKHVTQNQYGPVRVRHKTKSPQDPLFRPDGSQFEDFAEMMQEIVPALIPQLSDSTAGSANPSPSLSSPRPVGHKREASQDGQEGSGSRIRTASPREDALTCEEVLSVEVDSGNAECTVDVLLASFLQKKMQKELPAVGNPPEVQQDIDKAKITEWETLLGKNAIRIWKGADAKRLAAKHPDRFIGSRFVCTRKIEEEGTRTKARWCLQGHSDPDFKDKINSGLCHSPTLSQIARAFVLQIIVSKRWTLCLGDIKGAFLEAGPLNSRFRPLFARQPSGGVPGLDPSDIIEVTGNVYGSNDAPFNWYQEFSSSVQDHGWDRSQFDSCLFFLRGPNGELQGVLAAHVDDTIVAGEGPMYEEAVRKLKARYPYRKWRIGSGEFCGIQFQQCPKTFEIRYHQQEYARHLRPISVSKDRLKSKDSPANDREIAALRAINGAANWLSSQSRPDLCTQTSFSQQCFPEPKVKDLLFANQLVHRAKQYSEVGITVKYIPWDQLAVCFHSDAGFANSGATSTQGGFVISFVNKSLDKNEASPWSPAVWKSMRLPRVVASTLGAEAQVFSQASSLAEWMALMVTEAKQGSFDLRDVAKIADQPSLRSKIFCTQIIGITDCKSLFDHITSLSSVSKCDDKRVAIDLAIIKQCLGRTSLSIRWVPTHLQLADCLTKVMDATFLRTVLQLGKFRIYDEDLTLH